MENNKNQAEIYRAERKERLAKAAAKNAKKSPKSMKAKKAAKKVISIVLAVVIAVSAVIGVLSFFDIPEKTFKVSVDGIESKLSLGEINYYYYQSWYQVVTQVSQYDQYGAGMGLSMTGFDYTKNPDSQKYTEQGAQVIGIALDVLDTEEPTWADALTYYAVSQAVYAKYGAEKAIEAGIELTEDELKEVDTQIESMRETAKKNDYALNRWLRLNFGSGVTEKVLYDATIESSLASKYFTKVTEDTTAAVTDDQINDKYASAKDDYDIVDLRVYTFTSTLSASEKEDLTEKEINEKEEALKVEAKKNAEKLMAGVTDEKSFIAEAQKAILTADNKSKDDADEKTLLEKVYFDGISSSYGEDIAKWAFDDARKVNDVTVIEDGSDNFHVVFMKTLPRKDTSTSSSDVRHILVQFPEKNTDGSATTTTDDSGNKKTNITDETKAATKKEAQAILDEYLKNPTEENFSKLAKEKTEDTGSKDNGGLYENVSDNGQYVETFTDWAVDPARKPGDTGIVETSYGYHIMYYVKANEQTWFLTIKNEITNETLQKTVTDIVDGYVKSVNLNSLLVKWTINKEGKIIDSVLLNMLANSY